ncbi:hypothetical protein AALP_AA7G107400 [Arabis alpina]|uniref:Uncharacterized protein n=1 Tax=Arabis alpina TaxID=50452 RepID=A0A087GH87_ARAAL|nr:hypothetical protein AALP_AA7G107400 [Arabis alpina]
MTDQQRIIDPKHVTPRDLEEGEIQAEGSANKDQTARDDPPPAGVPRADPPPAGVGRTDPPGEKSKEAPRASLLPPELLQKMSTTLDALVESAERQNRANRIITDELRSIGADVRARPLEPGLFRKPVALNFTTPVGSLSRPRHKNPSTAVKGGRSALLAQARREKAKIGDEPIDLDNEDEDLARRFVPDTKLTETERSRQGTTKARNNDPRHAASQEFSTFGDDGPAKRVARNADPPEEEMVR